MPEQALMVLIFFAIILGAIITLIVILAYQKHKFNNKNNKSNYENSTQIRRKLLIECEKQKNSSQQTNSDLDTYSIEEMELNLKDLFENNPNIVQSASQYQRQTNYNSPNRANRQATATTQKSRSNYLPYHRKYLLTKREYGFYKKLKPIADKYNLQVLAKIRFADLVEVDENVNPNYKQTW